MLPSHSKYKFARLQHTVYFFLPFALVFEPVALEFVDTTLDALDGDVELALLALADFTLSSALFYKAG